MFLTNYLTRAKYLLMGLFITALLISGTKSTFAQSDFDPGRETFQGFKVLSVNGNIVGCERGVGIDVSGATLRRTIEVGDLLFASGNLTADANFDAFLQADTAFVAKSRDVEMTGRIQSVNGNSLTIFGNKVVLTDQTEIIGAETLQAEQVAIVNTDFQNGVFTAFRVVVPVDPSVFDMSVVSAITSIKNRKVSLVGDFSVQISEENLQFFEGNNIGVGSFAFVNLKQEPKSKKLKSPFVGVFSYNKQVNGKLQAIDVTNKTVTINDLVIPVGQFTRFTDTDFSSVKFSEINPDDYEYSIGSFLEISGQEVLADVFLLRRQN